MNRTAKEQPRRGIRGGGEEEGRAPKQGYRSTERRNEEEREERDNKGVSEKAMRRESQQIQ
jgi:hypothetical protein